MPATTNAKYVKATKPISIHEATVTSVPTYFVDLFSFNVDGKTDGTKTVFDDICHLDLFQHLDECLKVWDLDAERLEVYLKTKEEELNRPLMWYERNHATYEFIWNAKFACEEGFEMGYPWEGQHRAIAAIMMYCASKFTAEQPLIVPGSLDLAYYKDGEIRHLTQFSSQEDRFDEADFDPKSVLAYLIGGTTKQAKSQYDGKKNKLAAPFACNSCSMRPISALQEEMGDTFSASGLEQLVKNESILTRKGDGTTSWLTFFESALAAIGSLALLLTEKGKYAKVKYDSTTGIQTTFHQVRKGKKPGKNGKVTDDNLEEYYPPLLVAKHPIYMSYLKDGTSAPAMQKVAVKLLSTDATGIYRESETHDADHYKKDTPEPVLSRVGPLYAPTLKTIMDQQKRSEKEHVSAELEHMNYLQALPALMAPTSEFGRVRQSPEDINMALFLLRCHTEPGPGLHTKLNEELTNHLNSKPEQRLQMAYTDKFLNQRESRILQAGSANFLIWMMNAVLTMTRDLTLMKLFLSTLSMEMGDAPGQASMNLLGKKYPTTYLESSIDKYLIFSYFCIAAMNVDALRIADCMYNNANSLSTSHKGSTRDVSEKIKHILQTITLVDLAKSVACYGLHPTPRKDGKWKDHMTEGMASVFEFYVLGNDKYKTKAKEYYNKHIMGGDGFKSSFSGYSSQYVESEWNKTHNTVRFVSLLLALDIKTKKSYVPQLANGAQLYKIKGKKIYVTVPGHSSEQEVNSMQELVPNTEPTGRPGSIFTILASLFEPISEELISDKYIAQINYCYNTLCDMEWLLGAVSPDERPASATMAPSAAASASNVIEVPSDGDDNMLVDVFVKSAEVSRMISISNLAKISRSDNDASCKNLKI